ncbi:MAG TPA: hypothetical protein VFR67_23290 [Pilimelia sp.]|nr:hypothetical protein [Pilimelia sp.]
MSPLRKAPDGSVAPAATVQSMALSGGETTPLARMTTDGRQLVARVALWPRPHDMPITEVRPCRGSSAGLCAIVRGAVDVAPVSVQFFRGLPCPVAG